jgi:hypothetical protein
MRPASGAKYVERNMWLYSCKVWETMTDAQIPKYSRDLFPHNRRRRPLHYRFLFVQRTVMSVSCIHFMNFRIGSSEIHFHCRWEVLRSIEGVSQVRVRCDVLALLWQWRLLRALVAKKSIALWAGDAFGSSVYDPTNTMMHRRFSTRAQKSRVDIRRVV